MPHPRKTPDTVVVMCVVIFLLVSLITVSEGEDRAI
jgi:preprotein translocase subunit Sec61beta